MTNSPTHMPCRLYLALALLLTLIQPAFADDWTDKLRWESTDGASSLRIGGRIHGDFASISADDTDAAGDLEEWRRARLSLSAKLMQDWRFRYEYDFASNPDARIKDAWIGYYGFDDSKIRVGNLQAPISLEGLTSSNATTFIERALPNALVPGYRLGLLVNAWGDDWSLAGGAFEGPIRGREEEINEGWAIAGRAVFSPRTSRKHRLHAAISTEYRVPKGDERVSFSSRPEIHLSDRRMVSTGTLSQVDYTLTYGIELAGIWGPWSLQGEYIRTNVERSEKEDVLFDGWYLQGSWFITGGQRDYDYKDGAFDRVKPNGSLGAWEFAGRYSELVLENGPITGGKERNWTLGINWYLNQYTRIMFNWTQAKANPNRSGGEEKMEALQARFQFAF